MVGASPKLHFSNRGIHTFEATHIFFTHGTVTATIGHGHWHQNDFWAKTCGLPTRKNCSIWEIEDLGPRPAKQNHGVIMLNHENHGV